MAPIKRPPDWINFTAEKWPVYQEDTKNLFEQKVQSLEEYGKNPQYGVRFGVNTSDTSDTRWYYIDWYLDEDLCRTPEDYLEMSRHPISEVRVAAIMLSDCPKKVLFDVLKTTKTSHLSVEDLGRFGHNRSFNNREYDYLVAKAAIFSKRSFPVQVNPKAL
jgi:hypothetical protein